MNALKHGLSGQDLCLQADESLPYFELALRYIEDLRPVGVREEQLAQKIIDGNWRLNRVAAIENDLLSQDSSAEAWLADCSGPRALESLGRHEARIARTLSKMTADFDALQDRRLKADRQMDYFSKDKCSAWQFVSAALARFRSEVAAEEEAAAQAEVAETSTNETTSELALNCDSPVSELPPEPGFRPLASSGIFHSKKNVNPVEIPD